MSQHETMVSASSGLRVGVWGRLSLFGNLERTAQFWLLTAGVGAFYLEWLSR